MGTTLSHTARSAQPLTRWLVAGLALALAGCAAPGTERHALGRYQLVLPAGDWVELDATTAFQLPRGTANAKDSDAPPLRTRAWGQRGADGRWQALALLHLGDVRHVTTSWNHACPAERDVQVVDAAAGSPQRIDCLRFKRHAASSEWLQRRQPALAAWTQQIGGALPPSYGHLSHAVTTPWGDYVAIDLLAAQDLIRPQTHSNEAFLRAGQPGQAWSEAVAQAVRLSTAMLDGHLALPPFPFPNHSQ